MSFTPEALIEIYLKGALNDEAQAVFDQWMQIDPIFSDKMVEALKTHLGTAPESLSFVEVRLNAQIEAVWAGNKPSSLLIFIKKYFRQIIGGVLAAILALVLIHWASLIKTTVRSVLHLTTPALLPVSEGLPREIVGAGKSALMPPKLEPLTPKIKNMFKKRFKVPEVKPPVITNNVSYNYVNHSLQIIVDSKNNQKALILILDSSGKLVCNVYHGPWVAGHHVISWSGKDNMSNLVLPGKYTVVVQVNGQTTSSVVQFPDF
jgi:hypothetical protein